MALAAHRPSPLDQPEVAALLAGTPYADVGVDSRLGPHVTPAAFAAAGGRLWVVSSRRTVRVRAVRRTGHAAVLARDGNSAVAISGHAQVLSLWRRSEAVALVSGGLPAAYAAAAYTLRNAGSVLAGFVADVLMGAGDLTVYDRVLVAIEPDRGMRIEGDEVVDTWGRWRQRGGAAAESSPSGDQAADIADLLTRVPPRVAELLDGSHHASLGWSTPTGCVVLPATATGQGVRLHVPTAALRATAAPGDALACATVHESPGLRPSTFRGGIVRGRGRVTRRSAAETTVALSPERVSWWAGFESGTARAVV